MSNKKILIISILFSLTFIITIVAVILSINNNNEKEVINNIDTIKNQYVNFSSNINDHVEIRNNLVNKLSEYTEENYQEEHEHYTEILADYDKNIKYVDEIIGDLEKKCEKEYEDATINILCKSYDLLYEEMINLYVSHVSNYNNKITIYNKNHENKYEIHKMIHSEYIDFNKDSVYRGKIAD